MSFSRIDDHWLAGARACPSPHYNSRPDSEDISLLVVHNISLPPGQFDGPYIEQFFQGNLDADAHPYFAQIRDLRVSAHLLIRRDGSVIQFVPFNERAWHAGISCFDGRQQCNDFSIGIELEGTDTLPYTDQQYQSLAAITQTLMQYYPAITRDRITGHQHIAPGRKTDPGYAFDWDRLHLLLCTA
ncbi:1,6-anhydro-N-acetylmuramyl-L-alanine amidase AmpD [Salinivibrio sp. IB643]|uniref:1,6-anhydro-N-acetylmuramyl-L-alanine amidase AmpD n=1 Tax=Salinivibrio sp. IB643 TaxID=1909445 RepID=UPI000988F857|nr:1,6-anhydro-N-acetylmuramyl-L-alanine amidase AmpD [Salinivibrio sp. IB643]OOF00403.1 N-acetylmuramoyl-L-alanine amidase [Salinivibrio sp. IB643]